MREQRSDTATRAATGFAVIVTGVLVALAADRWSQGLQDGVLEREYVESLLADLLDDSLKLSEEIAEADLRHLRASALLDVIRNNSPAEAWPEALGVLPELDITAVYGPSAQPFTSSSTFEELESTGSLRLLSRGVRRALFRYYAEVSFWRERLQYLQSAERDPASMFMRTLEVADPLTFTPETLGAMSTNPQADNLVAGVVRYHNLRRRWFAEWQAQVGATLRAVREN